MVASALALSRRALIGAAFTAGALPSRLLAQPQARLVAGTYAQEGGPGFVAMVAGSEGWTAAGAFGGIRNASFGVRSDARRLRYLVDEQREGALAIYGPGYQRLAMVPTLGADPCHIALSPAGDAVAVANYSSGSVALWRLDPSSGLPVGEAQRIAHTGSGPNADRQAAAHAHWVGFAAEGRHLHAVDLGADAIFVHMRDARNGTVVETRIAYQAEAGSGPRHLANHPVLPVAYLVTELANTVTVLTSHADGTFAARQTLSTLPARVGRFSAAAHIAVNRGGTRLYVSNRGHDSIAVYAIDATGGLNLIQHAPCGGHWPRLFVLLEERGEMLVANQRSGNVARLPLGGDGRLGRAERGVSVPGVAFLSA